MKLKSFFDILAFGLLRIDLHNPLFSVVIFHNTDFMITEFQGISDFVSTKKY